MQIALVFAAAALYAAAISFGLLKEINQHTATAPIVVAGGVLIVIGIGTMGDWDAFSRWFMLFAAAGIPMLLRGPVVFVLEQRAAELKQYKPGDSHAEGPCMAEPR